MSTLTLIAGSKVGSLNVAISAATPTVLGAVPKLGANLQSGFIPEPGTAALLGLGLLGLGLRSRRRA